MGLGDAAPLTLGVVEAAYNKMYKLRGKQINVAETLTGEKGLEVGLNEEALTFSLLGPAVGDNGLLTAEALAAGGTPFVPFAPFADAAVAFVLTVGGAPGALFPLNGGIA